MRIIVATHNEGKLVEINRILEDCLGADADQVELVSAGSLNLPDPVEDGVTFQENALLKARFVAQRSGMPAIADDSGLAVDALGGAPGVYSARYAGEPKSDAANSARLIADLEAHADKSAYYYCVLVYVRHADDPQPVIADGRWNGEMIATPRGQGGFGYDPHFYLPALGKCAAELTSDEKNALSHRGQALRALVEKLR